MGKPVVASIDPLSQIFARVACELKIIPTSPRSRVIACGDKTDCNHFDRIARAEKNANQLTRGKIRSRFIDQDHP